METTENLAGKAAMYMQVNTPEQIGAVVGYARCAFRDNNGQKLKAQTAKVLELAAEHGLEIKAENIIAEHGSGAAARPGLSALLEQVDGWGVRALVVTNLDRLSRNSTIRAQLLDALVKNGITVITADETFDLSQPEDAAQWRLAGVAGWRLADDLQGEQALASKRGRAAARARLHSLD
jgi:DNA invertase Pin-like site-specific DNA recombinase